MGLKTENISGHEHCHPDESLHEKIDWVLATNFEELTSVFSRIGPWVLAIGPMPKAVQPRSVLKIKKSWNAHVDRYDPK